MRPLECGGCTACCRHDDVWMQPLDAALTYDVVKAPVTGRPGMGSVRLRRKANGDCVYLGERGCTIYERRPLACQKFDCRTLYTDTPRQERKTMIRLNPSTKAVFSRGRELNGTR